MPLLAFDARGYRLGYGGGFYDRTLAGIAGAASGLAIGFAFAAQEVDEVPIDGFDQRLDAMVTEQGVRLFVRGIEMRILMALALMALPAQAEECLTGKPTQVTYGDGRASPSSSAMATI